MIIVEFNVNKFDIYDYLYKMKWLYISNKIFFYFDLLYIVMIVEFYDVFLVWWYYIINVNSYCLVII